MMGMPYLSLFIRCLTKLAPLALAFYGLFCGIMELRSDGWKGLPMGTDPMEREDFREKQPTGQRTEDKETHRFFGNRSVISKTQKTQLELE